MQPDTDQGAPHLSDVGLPSSASSAREVMNAEEAAEFLRIPYGSFRRIASEVPRHRLTERRYVYIREELRDWLMRR
jgi:hypothetical protein